MFFSSDLLIFKKGKFSLIWLAATRGDRYLSKKDLKTIDIRFACSEIMEYVLLHQKIKLSLYLSSQLTFGLCVIYQKKIDRLLFDLQDLYKKSLLSYTLNPVSSDKYNGTKKPKEKQNANKNTLLDDFGEINESFGMIKNLEKKLIGNDTDMDLTNQIAYLNQARFEDITLMECDMGTNNLRTQLENDLEPMNVELLQELLGAVDSNKNDLETFLNKPFNVDIDVVEKDNAKTKENNENNNNNTIYEVDLDRTIDMTNGIDNNYGNVDNQINVDSNLAENNQVRNQIVPNIEDFNLVENNQLDNQVVQNIDFNLIDSNNFRQSKVKVSCVTEEVEIDQTVINDVPIIHLKYPRNNERTALKRPTAARKRKAPFNHLLIDETTTISHQVIRENMNKKCFGLVDKNTLFPNPYVSKSLKAQIACSAFNLFEFPGSMTTLRCPKLLRFWMNRKEMCRNRNSIFMDSEYIPPVVDEEKEVSTKKIAPDYSNMSIEKLREPSSSYNVNVPVDSFTFGSDSLQKSIVQNSFEADKTLEENNPLVPENVEEINHSVEKSMMPIIEEDVLPRQEQVTEQNGDNQCCEEIISKTDVWKRIQKIVNYQLINCKSWDDIRIGFNEICPRNSSKKTASLVFLTLLRLGKYGKIRVFQENSLAEIFICLPAREI